jgi:hypothetical protein
MVFTDMGEAEVPTNLYDTFCGGFPYDEMLFIFN